MSGKFFNLIFSTLVSFLMTLFMSFVLTSINIGFAVALPVSIFVIPLVRRIIEPWFRQEE